MLLHYLPVVLILLAGIFYSIAKSKLTVSAAITGAIIGFLVFHAFGYGGLAMMTAFFVLGTATTSWKSSQKLSMGLAEANKGKRTTGQVLANAGVAAVLAVLCLVYSQHKQLYTLMMAAAFASAAADTLSSELGNVYGSKFYNITTFKKDTRGLDGVVSLEGTLIGIIGSSIIAVIYFLAFDAGKAFVIVIAAGTIGNIADSFLGATLERKIVLKNNAVNFLNTAIAALSAWGMALLF